MKRFFKRLVAALTFLWILSGIVITIKSFGDMGRELERWRKERKEVIHLYRMGNNLTLCETPDEVSWVRHRSDGPGPTCPECLAVLNRDLS